MAIGWDDQIEQVENNWCGFTCNCRRCSQQFESWYASDALETGQCINEICECPLCIAHEADCDCRYCKEVDKLDHSGAGLRYSEQERLELWKNALPMKFTGNAFKSTLKKTASQQIDESHK